MSSVENFEAIISTNRKTKSHWWPSHTLITTVTILSASSDFSLHKDAHRVHVILFDSLKSEDPIAILLCKKDFYL